MKNIQFSKSNKTSNYENIQSSSDRSILCLNSVAHDTIVMILRDPRTSWAIETNELKCSLKNSAHSPWWLQLLSLSGCVRFLIFRTLFEVFWLSFFNPLKCSMLAHSLPPDGWNFPHVKTTTINCSKQFFDVCKFYSIVILLNSTMSASRKKNVVVFV